MWAHSLGYRDQQKKWGTALWPWQSANFLLWLTATSCYTFCFWVLGPFSLSPWKEVHQMTSRIKERWQQARFRFTLLSALVVSNCTQQYSHQLCAPSLVVPSNWDSTKRPAWFEYMQQLELRLVLALLLCLELIKLTDLIIGISVLAWAWLWSFQQYMAVSFSALLQCFTYTV